MTQIKWRKIDAKNLPKEAKFIMAEGNYIISPVNGLFYSGDGSTIYYLHKGYANSKVKVTHYLTESDLLQLEKE